MRCHILLLRCGLLLVAIVSGLLWEPVFAQTGTQDSDAEARRHLELGMIYERAEEWDKAIAEYETATIATVPEVRQAAFDGLERVLVKKSDPVSNLWRQRREPVVIAGLLLAVAVLLLALFGMWSLRQQKSLLIIPFTQGLSADRQLGLAIAETLASTLHEARLIHLVRPKSGITGLSDEIDLPSFTSQQNLDALVPTLNLLNSINISGIGLPVGSIVRPLFDWLTAGRDRIVGSLHRYGNTYRLIARLERGRDHRTVQIWQVSEEWAPEAAEQKIPDFVRSLAFEILCGLNPHWGTKSAKSLEQFTLGLSHFHSQQEDSRNTQALQRAALHFTEALAHDPVYFAAEFNLAVADVGLGHYETAIKILGALRMRPRNNFEPEIAYNRGVAYYQLAKDWAYDFSEKEFHRTLEQLDVLPHSDRRPKTTRNELRALTLCGLATVTAQRVGRDGKDPATHLGKIQENVRSALQIVSKDASVRAAANLAIGIGYLNARQFAKAIEELKQAIEIKPDYWRAYIYLGRAEMARGNLDESILYLEQAVAMNPGFVFAQFQLGQALKKRGDQSKHDDLHAIEAYRQAKGIAPAHAESGRSFAKEGRYDDALGEFRQAIRLNSHYSDGLADLAWYILESGHHDATSIQEAFDSAKKAVDLERGQPSESRMRSVLGRVYFERGDLNGAEREFRHSIALEFERWQSHYFLALTLQKQNRLIEARKGLIELFEQRKKQNQASEPNEWLSKASQLLREISPLIEQSETDSKTDVSAASNPQSAKT